MNDEIDLREEASRSRNRMASIIENHITKDTASTLYKAENGNFHGYQNGMCAIEDLAALRCSTQQLDLDRLLSANTRLLACPVLEK